MLLDVLSSWSRGLPLCAGNHVDEAAKELVRLLEDPNAGSSKGRNRLQLWHMLTDLIALHPEEVKSLRGRVESIVRAGVVRMHKVSLSFGYPTFLFNRAVFRTRTLASCGAGLPIIL